MQEAVMTDIQKREAALVKAGVPAGLARASAERGIDPRKYRTHDKGTTHLRIQSAAGRPVGKCGRIFSHLEASYIAVAAFSPAEMHELLGAHLHGYLSVEQVSQSGKAVTPVAPQRRPVAHASKLPKPTLVELAATAGLETTAKGKGRLVVEVTAAAEADAAFAELVADAVAAAAKKADKAEG